MSTATSERTYTPEDLLHLENGFRYELVDGRLVEKMIGAKASRITARLVGMLNNHVTANRLGHVLEGECGYQIFPGKPNRVRKPDVSFIARGRLENEELPDGYLQTRPDALGEVISPNDLAYDVDTKIEDYLDVNVPLIWIVLPPSQSVLTFRANGKTTRRRIGEDLSGEDVIPGFSIPIADLFSDPS